MINVDIEVGSKILAKMPVYFDFKTVQFMLEFKTGVVTKIVLLGSFISNMTVGSVKIIHFKSDADGKNHIVPDWRVINFSFGGIPMKNPKFDDIRIEKEDNEFIRIIKNKHNL